MDAFFPVVSLLAFLSGCCFGFYYAWRSGAMKPQVEPAKHEEPVRLRKAA